MVDDQTQQSTKIAELEKHQAVLDVKLDNITQGITEIKTNHLIHINDTLMGMNTSILDLGTSINTQVARIYAKIAELRIIDAEQKPTINIANKIIEYIILAVVGAILAFIFIKY